MLAEILTTLAHRASTLATLIKTTLCHAEREWYGVTVFPLPARRKECQKHVYLLMCSSRNKTGQKLSHLLFPFHLPCAYRKPDLPTCTNRVGRSRPEQNSFQITHANHMIMTTSGQILSWPDYRKIKENVNITLLDCLHFTQYMPVSPLISS